MIKFNDLVLSVLDRCRPDEATRLDALKAIVNAGPQIKPPRVTYPAKKVQVSVCQCVDCRAKRSRMPKTLLALLPWRTYKP